MESNVHQLNSDAGIKEGIKDLSPEWFAQEREKANENKELYAQALIYLNFLESIVATPPMVDEVEVLKNYVPDPHCKSCHGKGRLGVNLILDKEKKYKFYQLQLCYCVDAKMSDYARVVHSHDVLSNIVLNQTEVTSQLIEKISEMNKIQDANVLLLDRYLLSINKNTVGFWINAVIAFVARKYRELILLFTMKEEHAAASAEEVHQSAQQD